MQRLNLSIQILSHFCARALKSFAPFKFAALRRRALRGREKLSHIDAPWLQQLDFSIDAARVAREATVRAYDAVAGDDYRDFVVPHGLRGHLR